MKSKIGISDFSRTAAAFLFSLFLVIPAASAENLPSDPSGRVAEILRLRLEKAGLPVRMTVGNKPIAAETALPEFYLRRLFRPAWSEQGRPTLLAREMAELIREVASDGLLPEDYHLQAIERLLSDRKGRSRLRAWQLADLDLLLTDAFLILASHFQSGRIDPAIIDPEWGARRRPADPVQVLEGALVSGAVAPALRELRPPQAEYAGLRAALEQYRRIAAAGGWPEIPAGPVLKRGAQEERVTLLRQRLAITGDLPADAADGEFFDSFLEEAVRHFQRRHGLADDGEIGGDSLAALNVSAAERVRQIKVNLERWRWLPRELGERYLLVNIADYRLQLVEKGEPVLEMRVVVGRPYRRTPVFSDRMRYLVINPYWQVPDLIASEDILPQVQKDPGYLSRLNIRVFRGWGKQEREIDPADVDWGKYTVKDFPYRFRQEPGPLNALGRIKFMFPNRHDVYLHDTPARELFAKDLRSFSSGCIRLENALDLAERLLQGSRYGTPEALEAALAGGPAQTVHLPAPVPIHILYWTAWVDSAGVLQLRRDIYGRDLLLQQAIFGPSPEGERDVVLLSTDLRHE